jgi:hypothetical protein
MEFLNLHSSALDSPEMAGADPAELGTWLMLARYCAGQENGGVIGGCREWRDRKWQTVVRVAQATVMRETELWTWEGDDLHVKHYPAEQEAAVKAKRELARANGMRGGRPKRAGVVACETGAETDAKPTPVPVLVSGSVPTLEPTREPMSKPISEPISKSVMEGKEREGNEREVLGVCEKESTHGHGLSVSHSLASSRDLEISRQAETIVRSYPRHERFAEALMMVRGHLASGESFPLMLAGTKAAAEALAKAPAGAANKYAPSALKFFEGKRWMDDPATLIRPPSASATGGGGRDRGEMSAEELALQLGGRAY